MGHIPEQGEDFCPCHLPPANSGSSVASSGATDPWAESVEKKWDQSTISEVITERDRPTDLEFLSIIEHKLGQIIGRGIEEELLPHECDLVDFPGSGRRGHSLDHPVLKLCLHIQVSFLNDPLASRLSHHEKRKNQERRRG